MSMATSRAPLTFRFSLILGSTGRVLNRRTNRGSYQAPPRTTRPVPTPARRSLSDVPNGAVLDVVIDARPGSATFGRVMTFLLDDQGCTQVYIPRRFLHGSQALAAVTDVVYRIDEFHALNSDVNVRHDDPDLGILGRQIRTNSSPYPASLPLVLLGDTMGMRLPGMVRP
jgi:dTDP-4-dehydrorhamnose 3,5-epimerase